MNILLQEPRAVLESLIKRAISGCFSQAGDSHGSQQAANLPLSLETLCHSGTAIEVFTPYYHSREKDSAQAQSPYTPALLTPDEGSRVYYVSSKDKGPTPPLRSQPGPNVQQLKMVVS